MQKFEESNEALSERRNIDVYKRQDMGYETYRIADLIDEIAMGPFLSLIHIWSLIHVCQTG